VKSEYVDVEKAVSMNDNLRLPARAFHEHTYRNTDRAIQKVSRATFHAFRHACCTVFGAFILICSAWVGIALSADEGSRDVQAVGSGFEHVMSIGSKGDGDGQFNYVEDFELTSDGTRLMATDATNATVQVFDKTTGKFLTKFAGKGTEPDRMVKPEGISTAPDGRVFVADFATGFVKVYDGNFKWMQTFGNYGETLGEKVKLEFTCILDGKYYVAEAGNHRVSVWDLDGNFLFFFGKKGTADGEMSAPQACKVNSKGQILVSDLGNNRIQVFDAKGEFITKWGHTGQSAGALKMPSGLSVDKHDNVYVAELGNDRIQVFDSAGKSIVMFGRKGEKTGEFGNLHGCLVDRETGWLYVADTANNRIQVFKPTPEMAAKLGGTVVPKKAAKAEEAH